MAHPTDHYETFRNLNNKPRHKLSMSPSTMNPKSPQKSSLDYVSQEQIDRAFPAPIKDSHAYILISNFIRENPTWAIQSAYDYCLKYYREFGATKAIFAAALHAYIMSKD